MIGVFAAGRPALEILGRLRSDRVMRRPAPSRTDFSLVNPLGCRPPKRGGEFAFGDPSTWGIEQAVTVTDTRLYGKATARAWDRLHPRLTRRAAWPDHDGPLPLIEGTVIRLAVEKLPSGGVNKPVWLWWSGTGASAADADRTWQSFLRRFDLEYTFRLLKQTPGWTKPRLRSSDAADRRTRLVIAQCHEVKGSETVSSTISRTCTRIAPWAAWRDGACRTRRRLRLGSLPSGSAGSTLA
ncbi:hypothetical protein PUR34_02665 [Streptomyces sp. JV185]|uniref:hypothetical protein n=1 Tax=Streptomyces sp. JV185 TaxID=858638 RepID=UPI002E7A2FF3|nr:hypothetical protein [Streptomyces sp. JV185]MEE1767111.1 hypothetical protein [Streptomyces sp. JV185]